MLLPLVAAQDILIHHNLRIRREKPFKRRFHIKVQEWKFLKARILTFATVTGMLTNENYQRELLWHIFPDLCFDHRGVETKGKSKYIIQSRRFGLTRCLSRSLTQFLLCF